MQTNEHKTISFNNNDASSIFENYNCITFHNVYQYFNFTFTVLFNNNNNNNRHHRNINKSIE